MSPALPVELLPGGFHGIDDPHHDAADQQRRAHHIETFQILADHLSQQKGRQGGNDECDHHQTQRMGQIITISLLAFGPC